MILRYIHKCLTSYTVKSVGLLGNQEEDPMLYFWREQDLSEHAGPELLKTS